MSAKENFNKAMFDMFGVGKDEEAATQNAQAQTEGKVEAAVEKPAPAFEPAKPAPRTSPVTYLAPGTVVEGKLDAKGDVEIAGVFKGDIIATGKVTIRSNIQGNVTAESLSILGCSMTGDVKVTGLLTVNKGSVIQGNVSAGEVLCSGQVVGDLSVNGHSAFEESSQVEGNIATQTMTMARGARISGALTMNVPAPAPAKKD